MAQQATTSVMSKVLKIDKEFEWKPFKKQMETILRKYTEGQPLQL